MELNINSLPLSIISILIISINIGDCATPTVGQRVSGGSYSGTVKWRGSIQGENPTVLVLLDDDIDGFDADDACEALDFEKLDDNKWTYPATVDPYGETYGCNTDHAWLSAPTRCPYCGWCLGARCCAAGCNRQCQYQTGTQGGNGYSTCKDYHNTCVFCGYNP